MKKIIALIVTVIFTMAIILPAFALSSVAVKSIKLNSSKVTIQVSKTYAIDVIFSPVNATQKMLIYSTANKNVATVDSKGVIKGIKPGKTVITVSSKTNSKILTKCNITVVPALKNSVTLTMLAPPFEKTFAAGFQGDPVMKEIEKKTGVKLNITPQNAIADVKSKLTAMMASRDLPDIVYVEDTNIMKLMVTSKLALNLDPYVNNMPSFEKNRPGSLNSHRNKWSVDVDNQKVKGLYFVGLGGTIGNLYKPKVGFYVRWDLYSKIGKPKINTFDDYIPAIKKMLELEPTNKDDKKNYGVSAWFGEAGWGNWALHAPWSWATGNTIWANENVEFDEDKDDVKPSLTSPDSVYWSAIEWWNKAYRAGIVDPDAFTQKWGDYLEKVDAPNRAMMAWADFNVMGGEAAFVKDGTPQKGYIALPAPTTNRKTYVMGAYVAEGNRAFMISADSKNVDKAVDLLNFLGSWEGSMLIYNGIKGKDWDIVNGKPQLKDNVIKGLSNDADYPLKTGVNKYHNIAGMGEVDIWPQYNAPAKLVFMPNVLKSKLTPVEKDATKYFKVEYPGQIVTKGKEKIYSGKGSRFIGYVNNTTTTPIEVAERHNEIRAKLTEIAFTDIFKAVLAKSEAEFKEIKAELIEKSIKVGGNEYYEYTRKRFYNIK